MTLLLSQLRGSRFSTVQKAQKTAYTILTMMVRCRYKTGEEAVAVVVAILVVAAAGIADAVAVVDTAVRVAAEAQQKH